jgi:hypothetical protein
VVAAAELLVAAADDEVAAADDEELAAAELELEGAAELELDAAVVLLLDEVLLLDPQAAATRAAALRSTASFACFFDMLVVDSPCCWRIGDSAGRDGTPPLAPDPLRVDDAVRITGTD